MIKATKLDAVQVEIALRQLLKKYEWYQKTGCENTDDGYVVNLYIDVAKMRAGGGEIPRDIGNVKICLFNVSPQ